MQTHLQLTSEAAKKIGERLREARKKRGLAQVDIADACDISRAAVSLWELGGTVASRERLRRAAERLGVDVEWLLTGRRSKRVEDLPTCYSPALAREVRRQRAQRTQRPSHSTTAADIAFTLIPEMSNGIGSAVPYSQHVNDVHGFWSLPPTLTDSLRVKPEQLKVFPVMTDFMAPKICRGSLVFVDFAQTAPVDGGIFAIDNGRSIILKRIQVDDANPTHIGIADIIGRSQKIPAKTLVKKIIGRAVGQFSTL